MIPTSSAPAVAHSAAATGNAQLRKAAIELEATFLSEMLKSSGLAQTSKEFGGGAGEDQFSSFLRLEQARAIAASGGIGLAETLYQSLLKGVSNDQ